MPVGYFSLAGDPNIGVFTIATDRFVVAPRLLSKSKTARLAQTLELTRSLNGRVCGSKLLGVFASANSRRLVLPELCTPDEVEELRTAFDIDVRVISTKWTALGNCLLVNDYGGIVDQRIPADTVRSVEEALGVSLSPGTIAGLPQVGSLGVATNRGVYVHPDASEAEMRLIEERLKVPVGVGTVNGGARFVKVGLVANSHGAAVGDRTTGTELAAITSALGIR